MQSIANSHAEPSPQDLTAAFPCLMLHHWLAMVQAPLARMKMYMESCRGPDACAEEMRQRYLSVLKQCEDLLHAATLPPHLAERLAREEAQLNAAIHAQRTRKVGIHCKAALTQTAAD